MGQAYRSLGFARCFDEAGVAPLEIASANDGAEHSPMHGSFVQQIGLDIMHGRLRIQRAWASLPAPGFCHQRRAQFEHAPQCFNMRHGQAQHAHHIDQALPQRAALGRDRIQGSRVFRRFVRGRKVAAAFAAQTRSAGYKGILIRADASMAERMGGEEYCANT